MGDKIELPVIPDSKRTSVMSGPGRAQPGWVKSLNNRLTILLYLLVFGAGIALPLVGVSTPTSGGSGETNAGPMLKTLIVIVPAATAGMVIGVRSYVTRSMENLSDRWVLVIVASLHLVAVVAASFTWLFLWASISNGKGWLLALALLLWAPAMVAIAVFAAGVPLSLYCIIRALIGGFD